MAPLNGSPPAGYSGVMSRFIRCLTLFGALVTLCLLITASAQATHPRPKGATPIRMSLVPAYAACATPNRTHGPPLAFASCNPPAQTSAQATVGTPDAFGGAANATGYLRLTYWCCFHETGPADIRIDIALNDVRCVPTGARCGTANASGPSDYSGDMGFSFTFRLTDHWNATTPGGGTDPATVQDFTIEHDGWPLYPGGPDGTPCVQSASTSIGSTCNLNTSLDAFIPNAVPLNRRAVWALDVVRIFDGGADGDGDTTADNTVLARPGVFVP
jgi:hypothetical protein